MLLSSRDVRPRTLCPSPPGRIEKAQDDGVFGGDMVSVRRIANGPRRRQLCRVIGFHVRAGRPRPIEVLGETTMIMTG